MMNCARSGNRVGLILMLLLSPAAAAGGDAFAHMTLKGLEKVAVEVDGVRADFTRYGLDADTLRARTAARLAEQGLEVVDHQNSLGDPDVALIRIKLNANENQYAFYHYGIRLELKQKLPISEHGGYIAQTTWTSARTGVLLPMDLNRVNGYTADLVELFVKDYRAQNPASGAARVSAAQ